MVPSISWEVQGKDIELNEDLALRKILAPGSERDTKLMALRIVVCLAHYPAV
jgi:hypothetical protein